MTDPRPPASEQESPRTYEAAAARVEEIIRRLDSGEASLNETLVLVSEGKGLIELCARELAAVGDALQELRLDELVSRLEREAKREGAPSDGSTTPGSTTPGSTTSGSTTPPPTTPPPTTPPQGRAGGLAETNDR
jgi:exodeoxyribonuclease VII small subunit